MPELPEVESVVTSLKTGRPPLTGLEIISVDILRPGVFVDMSRDTANDQLKGQKFTEIRRHGKYMFFGVGDGAETRFWLCCHLRMTGRLFLVDELNAAARFTRLVFHLSGKKALRFDDMRGFGRFWMVKTPDEVIASLGPDALSIKLDQFVNMVADCRRQLKPLLLDQGVMAGIGNIYADEILFRAGLHPLTNCQQLNGDLVKKLHGAVLSVLSEAVDAKGANIDGVFEAGSFFVQVYGRAGNSCRVCGNKIIKIKVAQRGTHLCPTCQQMQ
jgi:formamidopyrimidine-DNA glycosylase